MARPLRIEYPGAVYHVTSRGNERRRVFRDDEDRRLFLTVLERTVERWDWIVHAYCLMGNHYHLVIETPEPTLSRGMRQINGEYTQAFNRRHHRAGHLFQGRFKAIVAEKESHLLELCRYVVLNPVRARGMKVKAPEDWSWSSYRATAGKVKPPKWLTVSWILSQFGKNPTRARQAYRRFVAQGLKDRTKIKARGGLWIGSDAFGRRLKKLAGAKTKVREHTRVQRRAVAKKSLKSYFPAKALKTKAVRDEAVYRAYREGRYSQKEIGDHLGLHYASISRIVRKLEKARRETVRSKRPAKRQTIITTNPIA
ncbi:MAG: transposase [Acidobacteriota bacterium]